MPNYKEMYQILFHETTKAISALKKAQEQAEEIYIAGDVTDKLVLIRSNTTTDKDGKKHPQQD